MEFTDEFVRERARLIPDAYNPDDTAETWDDPETATFAGYFDSQGSTDTVTVGREQTLSTSLLVLTDPHADVKRGDRIRQGPRLWHVVGFPDVPKNPFTGWTPGTFVTLREDLG
ncbi:hypothetical protein [Pseudoclavibacter sp. RFBB5]|uniref:hypothetical protein n=1 Tax=Pseudoclavibacter sp. RFBB5 TaxID=2080574 RepID=UPI000CE840E8|nr:hypothetical protein [Pseudoclavibacter sp. RFBB5]PPG29648.1 hypothetical protein C5B97_11795 [Pseudoclavibacter sp. RFBB5]